MTCLEITTDTNETAIGKNKKRKLIDKNRVVQTGMVVSGRFVKKISKGMAMVVHFRVGSTLCTGVLHVSQFPSSHRPTRDRMFQVAEVGPNYYSLKVIDVVPPSGKRRLTIVRLTARQDFNEELFRKSKICQ